MRLQKTKTDFIVNIAVHGDAQIFDNFYHTTSRGFKDSFLLGTVHIRNNLTHCDRTQYCIRTINIPCLVLAHRAFIKQLFKSFQYILGGRKKDKRAGWKLIKVFNFITAKQRIRWQVIDRFLVFIFETGDPAGSAIFMKSVRSPVTNNKFGSGWHGHLLTTANLVKPLIYLEMI
jgi:hypothetical protein